MAFSSDQAATSSGRAVENSDKKNVKAFSCSGTVRVRNFPLQIWQSNLSWRVAGAVFLTIMFVQAAILSLTIKTYEQNRLDELAEVGRSAIVSLMSDPVVDLLKSPISRQEAVHLVSTTKVNGLSVYSTDFNLLANYGDPVVLTIRDHDDLPRTYRSADGSAYEVVFRNSDLQRPFVVVARLDSSAVPGALHSHVQETILIMMLMSAFVTTVLMIALGRWLLEPVLFLRDSLGRASENPESPNVRTPAFNLDDEIGGLIKSTLSLINQNAENLRHLKSTAEDQIHRLAYYDSLTDLPNRTYFLQALNDQAKTMEADGRGGRFAIVTMDLDHFKDINDSMGHNVGDAILRAVGKRLRAAMPDSAIVARSGEDEFAVTMPLTDKVNDARDIAEKVAHIIKSEPFKAFSETFQVRASIGVSTYPDDGTDPDQVLKNADIALNQAKEKGRDTIREYSEDFDRAVQQRFQMLRDLRDALEQDQLLLYFQPQFDLKTGKMFGSEALIRWWKPDDSKEGGHFVPPVDFIPIAEQSGLIVLIGEWILRKACETMMTWHEAGYDFNVSVNVSGAQFYQSDFPTYLKSILAETGLPADRLELEITESVFMDDINHTIKTLQDIHKLGVEIAIDDFGTGYSSLSYLRQFPIDRLKIDQSFIRNALNNADDAAITRTIIGLGHSLNLQVIAEGVETKEHEDFLIEHGCDEVQGFRYSRPVSTEEIEKLLKNYKGNLNVCDAQ